MTSHFLITFYFLNAQIQTTFPPTLSRSICLRVEPLLTVMAGFFSPFRHCSLCCRGKSSVTRGRICPSSNLCLSHCYCMHLHIYNFMHRSKTHTHIYRRPLSVQILCYSGSLIIWTVLSLTTAEFKPLSLLILSCVSSCVKARPHYSCSCSCSPGLWSSGGSVYLLVVRIGCSRILVYWL
jgi:hypothetical protein